MSSKGVPVPIHQRPQPEQAARPTLKELLLAESPRAEIPVPLRQGWRRRAPVALE
jgi:hypothetical protein